jgi:SAM-dependent methyltransferase
VSDCSLVAAQALPTIHRRQCITRGEVQVRNQSKLRLSNDILKLLRCPICGGNLDGAEGGLFCQNRGCGALFPVLDGMPILINEDNSVFTIDDIATYYNAVSTQKVNRIKDGLKRTVPSISRNMKAKENYGLFAEMLLSQSSSPLVLVLGGASLGKGMELLLSHPSIDLVESDVRFGPRTRLICDAHDIPFDNGSLDGVIIQAVLEHLVDPHRCVDEIHRVLKDRGLVYAETPFMQQVHERQYDFTRFTLLGHRRLFREFEEIKSGALCGPGMALAWSYQYFLLSFTTSRLIRRLIRVFSRLTTFYLKYFDYFLIERPGSLDAASAYYFLGRRSDDILSDRELITGYRGAF